MLKLCLGRRCLYIKLRPLNVTTAHWPSNVVPEWGLIYQSYR